MIARSAAGGNDLNNAVAKRALESSREGLLQIIDEAQGRLRDVDKALAALEGRSIPVAASRLFSISDCAKAEDTSKGAIAKRLERLPQNIRAKRVKKGGQNFLPEHVALHVVLSADGVRALHQIAAEDDASRLSNVNVAPVLSPAPADQSIVSSTESLGFRERENDDD